MIPLLDHGYVKLIETWGSDQRVIEAARMSTDKGFQGWGAWHCPQCQAVLDHATICACGHANYYKAGDEKLLAYLYKNKHFTPFEMSGLIVEVQAPIFVFREWQRHRTQSYNELSARYTELPNLFYTPSTNRLCNSRQSTSNKQGSDGGFSEADAATLGQQLTAAYTASREAYDHLLTQGLSREVARLVVPVAQYSRMRASANLRNWLQFLDLRMAPNAQFEIREYANAVATLVKEKFPKTFQLFDESI